MEFNRMRKIVFATATAAAVLTLAACSQRDDRAGETTAEATPAAEATSTAEAGATAQAGGVLDANTATEEQLAGASGMTPEAAKAIVAGRPYKTVVDLNTKLRASLSEQQAGTVLSSVFVPVNLNTATEEEIKLIPGMTEKMVHEFLEYRPYEDMAEFDREIGKYVNAAEVARFRRYVTL
jgi:DNA uptake protein ComE-like DNA-binding protein